MTHPVSPRFVPERTPPTVRDLRWSDADPFIDMYWGLYEERRDGQPIGITLFAERPSRSDEVAWFASLYRKALDGESIVVVAECDGRPAGHCEIWPVRPGPTSETSHVGELGIVVDRPFRGRGCGTALLRAALARARGKFEVVRLSVFATNARAQRLYERFGFATVGRFPAAIRRGGEYIDEVLMFVDLRAAPAPSP